MPVVRSVSSLQHRIRRQSPPVLAMRRSLLRSQWYDPERLRRLQDRRLRALVRWAALRSPFYRDWFRSSGIDPREIRGVDDLPLLPLIDRSHLIDRPDDFLAYPKGLAWAAHSSGTSGRPVTVYRTVGSSMFELASLQRQWGWFGVPPGARSAVLRGSSFAGDDRSVVVRENPGGNQLMVSSFRLTPDHLPAIWDALVAFRPVVMEGWPSSLTLLASLLRDAGRRLPVRGVITSSEVITPAQADLLRSVFVGPIIDHYGQTERVVQCGGCEAGGYHVFPEYGILELLPIDGSDEREIVGTALHNWGFPLLRYRTGDRMAAVPEEPCPCGRAFPRFGLVEGRVEDVARAADGRPVPLPSTIVDDLAGLREVQLVQHRPGVFEIRMVPGVGYDRRAIERLARENLEAMAGGGQELTFTEWESIPRPPSGKLRPVRIVDDRVQPAPERGPGPG